MKTLTVIILLAVVLLAQDAARPGAAGAKGAEATASGKAVPDLASQVPAARPEDVKTVDGLLRAIYDVISGPAGDRDWNRLRSLFVPQARFTRTGKGPDGSVTVTLFSVDELIQAVAKAFKDKPFYENAIVNQVQTYGNMAQVFSSYESRRVRGEEPFQRGINSIQLFNDGTRWWVLSILWDEERADNPLPAELAAAKK